MRNQFKLALFILSISIIFSMNLITPQIQSTTVIIEKNNLLQEKETTKTKVTETQTNNYTTSKMVMI
ncbi:MAG: hypothetical protein ACFFD2_09920 [Promethearchaeota archaeon]